MSGNVGLSGINRASVMGAVIAGGKSTRFGSDKAIAAYQGRQLIDHAIASLADQTAEVVICGRQHDDLLSISDQPAPGMGPLGGIAAALIEAQARGYAAVLTAPCDAINLPDNLLNLLFPFPAYAESLPVIGLWPVSAAADALAILESEDIHSVKAFARRISAQPVKLPIEPANINTAADLERVERHGL